LLYLATLYFPRVIIRVEDNLLPIDRSVGDAVAAATPSTLIIIRRIFFFMLPRSVKFVATSDAAAAATLWNIMFTVIKSLRVSIIRIYFPINFSDMILITVSSILCTETVRRAYFR